MNTPNSWRRLADRAVAGFAGSLVLLGLVNDVRAGIFQFHGEVFRRIEHPIGFWLWAALVMILGLSAVYWSVFGNSDGSQG